MSGFVTQPPSSSSNVFNSSFYSSLSSSSSTPASVKGIISGTAAADKALVLDASKNISTIANLTANRLLSLNTTTSEVYRSTVGSSICTNNHELNGNFIFDCNNSMIHRIGGGDKLSITSAAVISSVRLSGPTLHAGNAVDTTRLISALDSGMVHGSVHYITLGKAASNSSCAEISYRCDNTLANSIFGFGFHSVPNVLVLQANRTLLFNCANNFPASQNAAFHINGSISKSVGPGYGLYSSGVFNHSGSTQPISLYTSSSIWCGDTVYSTSDRRLKCNIDPIARSDSEKLLKARAYTYNWISDPDCPKKQVGLIAQDLIEIGLTDLVGIVPNSEEGLDGFSYVVQYDKVAVYLIDLVKSMHEELSLLKDITDKLAARPVTAKWLASK